MTGGPLPFCRRHDGLRHGDRGTRASRRRPLLCGSRAAGIVLFGMHQTRLTSTEPLLDVKHLLHNRVFVLSNIASLAMFSSLFAITFFFSLYLQYVKNQRLGMPAFGSFAEPLAELRSRPSPVSWPTSTAPSASP